MTVRGKIKTNRSDLQNQTKTKDTTWNNRLNEWKSVKNWRKPSIKTIQFSTTEQTPACQLNNNKSLN